ncbi:serine/threonine-protein kinase [Bosea sp. (in: a-proteobacteria)]|uniref:serine/threonine-protein kinase n=1 Tax=Bosea sp. (in: a-proteobacteria) TaxID=1871050 RepID=UPI00260EB826|nr:serine/threonine protein kinase [Bosea sp. (in: a-proteobacteria)]MCO5093529.1 protein kinase [Bosea sp. (in: a-proteobacteria)]
MSDDPERTVFAPRGNARIGTTLNGIYEIESLIAVGGMGEVYKGRAIQTGDAVAIKMIRPDMARDEAALALFRREAAALHNLYNEAIVRYYVFTIDPVSEAPYLAMEFVDGQPLSERIAQRPLTVEEANILRQRVGPGLHAAHRLGIIHRDISPDNIILPGGDPARAKIIDFGIARSSILGEGTVIGSGFAGKYNYVSPEQLGLYGGEVSGRSDMYSFALVLAQALTGRAIDMGGSQADILDKRRRLPDLSGVDAALRPLIARMLAPDPNDRPADMTEVATWEPPAPGRKATGKAAPKKSGRSPLPLVAGIAALALIAGGGFYAWTTLSGSQAPQSATSEPPPLAEQPTTAPVTEAKAPPVLAETPAAAPPPQLTEAPAQASAPAAPAPPVETAPVTPVTPLPAQTPIALPPVAPPQTAQPQTPPQPQPKPQQQSQPTAAASGPQVAINVEPPAQQPSAAPPPAIETKPEPPPVAVAPQPPPSQLPAPTPQPAVVAPEPEPRTPAERIERYVRDYDGGPCFFLWPLEIGDRKATLEGFGSTSAPFVAFDTAFKAAHGFEAQIQLRPMTEAQCPMVEFLRRPGIGIDRSPRIQIGAFNMKSGEILNGTVEATGGRNLDIVLIGDDGLVYNLASFMKREGDKVTFNLKLESTGGAARPQTVLALVTQEPLPALSGPNPAPASEFFANLKLDLARQTGKLGLGIKYFRIE